MVQGFFVRPAEDADREDICRLLTGMGARDSAARYEWIYRANPHGRALTWIAVENATRRVVACTSLFPRRVLVDGRERTGSIGGDCYVEPRVRRRGLATLLHRTTFDAMDRGDVSFMYGPPTAQNLAALLKAGSRLVGECEQWVLPLGGGALRRFLGTRSDGRFLRDLGSALLGLPRTALRRLGRERSSVMLKPVRTFGPEFDRLFERVAPACRIIALRDRSYLTWRYLEAPSRQQIPFAALLGGELVGFAALETVRGRASVVDFLTVPTAEVFPGVVEAVISQATAQGCDIVTLDAVSKALLRDRIRDNGFFRARGTGFQVAASEHDPQLSTLRDPTAWHFMMGDTDLDVVSSTSSSPSELTTAVFQG